jgi:hypothetical protein
MIQFLKNLFGRKPKQDTFQSWHSSEMEKYSKWHKDMSRFGEDEITREPKKRLIALLTGVYKHALSYKDSSIEPWDPDLKPFPVDVMWHRSFDECGWVIGLGTPLDVSSHSSYNNRQPVEFIVKRFPGDVVTTKLLYRDVFENIFQDAVANNYYIEPSDDHRKMTFGFTVFKGDGIYRYEIRRADYNSPTKSETKKMGYFPWVREVDYTTRPIKDAHGPACEDKSTI